MIEVLDYLSFSLVWMLWNLERRRRQKRQTNTSDSYGRYGNLLIKAQIPCAHRPYSPMRHLCIGSPSLQARDNF
jgi:hypothetical protein